MTIDAVTFRAIASSILPRGATLSPDEAAVIVQLCFYMTRADLEEDPGELSLRERLSRYVSALGGIAFESVPAPSPLPIPHDHEARRALLREIARRLTSRGARELAYVLAYLLVVDDLALARVEAAAVNELQEELEIDDARASELVAHASEQATPMEHPATSAP